MNKYITIVIAGLFLASLSCKKGDNTPTGGKGGNAILRVTPRHHGRQIDSCTIYIKFNAVDPPADGHYDDSAQTVLIGGLPVATISGLKQGNYYLYGFGWDPLLSPPQHVKGGVAYTIASETDQSTDIPVSEE